MQGQSGVSHITFLIVDDVPTIQQILRRTVALGSPQAVVYCAGTVAEARRILTHQTISIVITDYHLPDGNGFDVVNATRGIARTIPTAVGTLIEPATPHPASRGSAPLSQIWERGRG